MEIYRFFALFVFVSVPHSYSGDRGQDEITVILPGPALSKVFSELLPMRTDPDGRVSGDLLIESVRHLRFDKNKVLCSPSAFLGSRPNTPCLYRKPPPWS